MVRKLYLIYKDFSRQMSRQNISAFAASTAFFIFLSLIPLLIMICTIIPFTPLTEENLLKVFTDYTPEVFDPLITSLISQVYDKSAGILSVAALTTVWSAAKGVLALIRGLNAVNGVVEKRNYIQLRLVATFYTMLIWIMTILSLLIMVFGPSFVALIEYHIPQLTVVFDWLMHLRFLLVWAVLTILLTLLYAFMPSKKRKIQYQIPGAAFSAVSWSVFSWGFSIYVNFYDGVNAYGTLSIIILIMLWLYFCIYIIMVGAYLNRYFSPAYQTFYRQRRIKAKNRQQKRRQDREEGSTEERSMEERSTQKILKEGYDAGNNAGSSTEEDEKGSRKDL